MCVYENDASGKFSFNFRPGQYPCVLNAVSVPILMYVVGSLSLLSLVLSVPFRELHLVFKSCKGTSLGGKYRIG